MSIKQLRNYAAQVVNFYATFDGESYYLGVTDLPDFVQNQFAAYIMVEEEDYASEANGPDNKHWDKKMLPALLRYLQNSTDADEAIEFRNVWTECVTSYCHSKMQELLDDALQDYNEDEGHTIKDWNHYHGVSHLFGVQP